MVIRSLEFRDKKVLVILGPTATRKTDLALTLAKKYNGELVACDSRQVYRGLDVGTGKFPSPVIPAKVLRSRGTQDRGAGIHKSHGFRIKYGMTIKKGKGFWEIDGVKIWMYDVSDFSKQYTVADYVEDATKAIEKIISRNKLPIIVGGTGLYIKALLEGLPNLAVPIDEKLREELGKLNKAQLQSRLQQLSHITWKNMNESDRQNPRRLLRSIELLIMNPYIVKTQNNTPTFNKLKLPKLKIQNLNILKVGLIAPRKVLYEKINSRVFDWLNQGIIFEVKKLIKRGVSLRRIRELGLEYAVVADYLDGKITKEKMVDLMQTKTRQYAKRQITWFKKERYVTWFDITDENFPEKVEKEFGKWYYRAYAKKD